MSYFLFGGFNNKLSKQTIQSLKLYGNNRDVYFWFNEEINFYEDIHKMYHEQEIKKNCKFALTSKNQFHNSSDLLFPYDKYSNEKLFSDPTREYFKKCCENNINILFDCLKRLIELPNLDQIDILVVEGYDNNFIRKKCTLEEMRDDLLLQIEKTSFFINSCIYQILY